MRYSDFLYERRYYSLHEWSDEEQEDDSWVKMEKEKWKGGRGGGGGGAADTLLH